jgi:chromosome segregation and condensation protein ScpB
MDASINLFQMAVGYFQPVTRGELSEMFGKEVSRDTVAALRGAGFIGSGPRSPTPGAPLTYVTTPYFLSLRDGDARRSTQH